MSAGRRRAATNRRKDEHGGPRVRAISSCGGAGGTRPQRRDTAPQATPPGGSGAAVPTAASSSWRWLFAAISCRGARGVALPLLPPREGVRQPCPQGCDRELHLGERSLGERVGIFGDVPGGHLSAGAIVDESSHPSVCCPSARPAKLSFPGFGGRAFPRRRRRWRAPGGNETRSRRAARLPRWHGASAAPARLTESRRLHRAVSDVRADRPEGSVQGTRRNATMALSSVRSPAR
jgi:hypothetical protein